MSFSQAAVTARFSTSGGLFPAPPPTWTHRPLAIAVFPICGVRGGPLLREHRLEQLLRTAQSLGRVRHRLGLVDRIADHALCVQAAQRIPIEALPGAILVMEREIHGA